MKIIFLIMTLISSNYTYSGQKEEIKPFESTLVFEHLKSKEDGLSAVKEVLSIAINDPKLAVKVDDSKKGKIIAHFNSSCSDVGLFGMDILVYYSLTANFKHKKTRLILTGTTILSNDVKLKLTADNGNKEGYAKCRSLILKSIRDNSLNPKNEDTDW